MKLVRLQGHERDSTVMVLAGHGLLVGSDEISVTPLSFYPGCRFLHIEGPDRCGDFVLFDAEVRGGFLAVNRVRDVHYVNHTFTLVLTEHTVLDYVRFFTRVMSIEWGGDFHVLGADDLVGGGAKPQDLTLDGRDESGRFLCSGLMIYENGVCWCKLAVRSDGDVDMVEESLVATLPLATAAIRSRRQ